MLGLSVISLLRLRGPWDACGRPSDQARHRHHTSVLRLLRVSSLANCRWSNDQQIAIAFELRPHSADNGLASFSQPVRVFGSRHPSTGRGSSDSLAPSATPSINPPTERVSPSCSFNNQRFSSPFPLPTFELDSNELPITFLSCQSVTPVPFPAVVIL